MDNGNIYRLLGEIPELARQLESAAQAEGMYGKESNAAWEELITTVKAAIKAVDDLKES